MVPCILDARVFKPMIPQLMHFENKTVVTQK